MVILHQIIYSGLVGFNPQFTSFIIQAANTVVEEVTAEMETRIKEEEVILLSDESSLLSSLLLSSNIAADIFDTFLSGGKGH